MVHYIDKVTPEIRRMVDCCFPDYCGKKFKVSTDIPRKLDSYWDGGSKTSFAFYDPATGTKIPVANNHPFFERQNPNELPELPKGIILVAHSIFCGKDMGITFYVNASDIPAYLETPKTEVSPDMKIVLGFTARLKSSYGGISNYRFHEAHKKYQISKEDWDFAKESAIQQGFLTKGGGITPAGRNAISDLPSNFTW